MLPFFVQVAKSHEIANSNSLSTTPADVDGNSHNPSIELRRPSFESAHPRISASMQVLRLTNLCSLIPPHVNALHVDYNVVNDDDSELQTMPMSMFYLVPGQETNCTMPTAMDTNAIDMHNTACSQETLMRSSSDEDLLSDSTTNFASEACSSPHSSLAEEEPISNDIWKDADLPTTPLRTTLLLTLEHTAADIGSEAPTLASTSSPWCGRMPTRGARLGKQPTLGSPS